MALAPVNSRLEISYISTEDATEAETLIKVFTTKGLIKYLCSHHHYLAIYHSQQKNNNATITNASDLLELMLYGGGISRKRGCDKERSRLFYNGALTLPDCIQEFAGDILVQETPAFKKNFGKVYYK